MTTDLLIGILSIVGLFAGSLLTYLATRKKTAIDATDMLVHSAIDLLEKEKSMRTELSADVTKLKITVDKLYDKIKQLTSDLEKCHDRLKDGEDHATK